MNKLPSFSKKIISRALKQYWLHKELILVLIKKKKNKKRKKKKKKMLKNLKLILMI